MKLTDTDKKEVFKRTFQGVIANVDYFSGSTSYRSARPSRLAETACELAEAFIEKLENKEIKNGT